MRQWIGVLARLIVGAVDLVAGIAKFPDPAGNVRQVRAFQILPEAVVPTVGHALPTAEIIIGIAAAWARGLEINCGCFGSHGVPANPQRQYAVDIARDVGLLICSLWLIIWPRTRLALDNLLFPHHERLADGDESEEAVEV